MDRRIPRYQSIQDHLWQQKYDMLVAITSAAIGTNLAWVRWRTNETGELYVADSFNHVLRRIRALQVTTV